MNNPEEAMTEAGRAQRSSTQIEEVIDVTDVRVLARYVVELAFANGAVRVLDLEPYLWGPMFEAVTTDYDVFCGVRADPASGTIVWPNGADLSPRMLYADSKPAMPV